MRIYSSTLTVSDVEAAFATARREHGADIWAEDPRSFEPRKRSGYRHGTGVFAYSLHGWRVSGHRPIGSYDTSSENRAAAWDAWGWVIAILYAQDPDARIGWYRSRADFIARVHSAHRQEPKDFLDLLQPPSHQRVRA